MKERQPKQRIVYSITKIRIQKTRFQFTIFQYINKTTTWNDRRVREMKKEKRILGAKTKSKRKILAKKRN